METVDADGEPSLILQGFPPAPFNRAIVAGEHKVRISELLGGAKRDVRRKLDRESLEDRCVSRMVYEGYGARRAEKGHRRMDPTLKYLRVLAEVSLDDTGRKRPCERCNIYLGELNGVSIGRGDTFNS
jgi:hypothetical protein